MSAAVEAPHAAPDRSLTSAGEAFFESLLHRLGWRSVTRCTTAADEARVLGFSPDARRSAIAVKVCRRGEPHAAFRTLDFTHAGFVVYGPAPGPLPELVYLVPGEFLRRHLLPTGVRTLPIPGASGRPERADLDRHLIWSAGEPGAVRGAS